MIKKFLTKNYHQTKTAKIKKTKNKKYQMKLNSRNTKKNKKTTKRNTKTNK